MVDGTEGYLALLKPADLAFCTVCFGSGAEVCNRPQADIPPQRIWVCRRSVLQNRAAFLCNEPYTHAA